MFQDIFENSSSLMKSTWLLRCIFSQMIRVKYTELPLYFSQDKFYCEAEVPSDIHRCSRALYTAHGAALYFAMGHCVHGSPRTPENPALHMQCTGPSLASAASEFEGQSRHTSDVTLPSVSE